MQNESHRSSRHYSPSEQHWIHQDPRPVTLLSFGGPTPVGWATNVRTRTEEVDGIQWRRFDIQSLRFSHTASLLVLQGYPLLKFFEHAAFRAPGVLLGGYFMFLRGALTPFYAPPLCLEDIVLGTVISSTKERSPIDILGTLLPTVLAS